MGPVGGVDRDEEAGQSLAGAGGRGDQHVAAFAMAGQAER